MADTFETAKIELGAFYVSAANVFKGAKLELGSAYHPPAALEGSKVTLGVYYHPFAAHDSSKIELGAWMTVRDAVPQAAAYAETIQRKAPLTQTITGNRITAGDMQSGTDRRVTSSGDTRIWRDMIDGR